jgi:hypothetical protein
MSRLFIIPAARLRAILRLALTCLVLGGAVPDARALEVADLYEATVPVAGRSQPEQAKGMAEAFRIVAGKVVGQAPTAGQLAPLLRKTQQHVRSYAYLGGKGQPLLMQVSFDRVAVDASLQAAGLSVWGSNRPLVLLWLAIDEAGQRRIVSSDSDAALADLVSRHVNQRGTPVNLPIYDLQDMSALSVADVWGQFDDRIRSASAHYRADLIATARLRQEGASWSGDWTLSMATGPVSTTLAAASRDEAVQAGLHWLSSQVTAAYASVAEATVPGSGLTLVVSGVRDVLAHATLSRLLSASVAIRSVALERVEGEQVTFVVVPAASTDTLLQSLLSGGRLALPDESPDTPSKAEGVIRLDWKG